MNVFLAFISVLVTIGLPIGIGVHLYNNGISWKKKGNAPDGNGTGDDPTPTPKKEEKGEFKPSWWHKLAAGTILVIFVLVAISYHFPNFWGKWEWSSLLICFSGLLLWVTFQFTGMPKGMVKTAAAIAILAFATTAWTPAINFMKKAGSSNDDPPAVQSALSIAKARCGDGTLIIAPVGKWSRNFPGKNGKLVQWALLEKGLIRIRAKDGKNVSYGEYGIKKGKKIFTPWGPDAQNEWFAFQSETGKPIKVCISYI